MIDKLIKDIGQINTKELTVKQMFRISLSQKRYLLIHNNKLYFTDNIQRLIRDKFKYISYDKINIYMIN